jgi:nucleoside-diphosphate-sugar epimerase
MSDKNNGRLILVTGGGGFIGSHIVAGLLERGDAVRVLDNFSTGKRENLQELGSGGWEVHRDFELVEGDIRDPAAVDRACTGVDRISPGRTGKCSRSGRSGHHQFVARTER